jgi:uncharacterized protein YgbK (DUF1537 family)
MTIAILADDFTGAAELGAVALRYGLSARVQGRWEADSGADVLVLNTDSRSLTVAQAAGVVAKVARPLRGAATWVYKKVDSVLRGPVVAEIEAALDSLHLERALLAPANPSLGRTIREGRYYVGDVPLNETHFASDAEYPARTADVLTLLGRGQLVIAMVSPGQKLSAQGIFVGQTETPEDLAVWARQVSQSTLPVGGSEFFAAVLQVRGHKPADPIPVPPRGHGPRLWVCGSAPACAAVTIEQARARGVAVLPMPQELAVPGAEAARAMKAWADQACDALGRSGAALVSIGTGQDRPGRPALLTGLLMELAVAVLRRVAVGEVYVEGGSTAAALAGRMGWRRFDVLGEWAPGVVTLRVFGGRGRTITMKPGSYAWPDGIWP